MRERIVLRYSHLSHLVTLASTLMSLLSCFPECCNAWNNVANISSARHTQDHDWPTEDYCNGETFRPRCLGGKNDVIVMTSARLGRMKFGRCLEEDPEFAPMMQNPRFFGCWTDVKSIIDQLCSGRSECDVLINDQSFDGVKPCFAHLKMFLEVSYICVKVAAESRHCTVPLTTEPQHIVGGGTSSRVLRADTVGCGSQSHPWSIEALAGQRIAVSLIEFDQSRRNMSTETPGCHPVYGYVIDRNTRKNVTLCRSIQVSHSGSNAVDDSLKRTVLISTSNQLQLVTREDVTYKFIIRVEAVGCSDLAPPSDEAWIKRIDNQLTVGCYMSRQSWQLNCVNGVWTGTVGVCSQINNIDQEHAQTNTEEHHRSAMDDSKLKGSTEMAVLVTVASIGVTLCCLVICVGIVCLHRQNKQSSKENETSYQHQQDDKGSVETHRLTTCSVVYT